jgi:hypothetical protein
MTQENNKILDNNVIYVNFRAQQNHKVAQIAADPTPAEIHALFAPRFGAEFTAWFIEQYEQLEA